LFIEDKKCIGFNPTILNNIIRKHNDMYSSSYIGQFLLENSKIEIGITKGKK
jgi:hypothetical protein